MNKKAPQALLEGLDELISAERVLPLENDDITIVRVMTLGGFDRTKAKAVIEKWLKAEKIVAIGARKASKGHVVEAWRLIK